MTRWSFPKKLGAIAALIASAVGLPIHIQAAPQDIVFVSYHAAEDTPAGPAATWGFSQAADIEYTRLLRAAGHNVTRYVTTASPDTNFLNGFDLVIISRSVPSGHYQTDPSPALWHSLTKPTMILGGYILRAARLGYTYGDTMADTSEMEMRLQVNDPAHPIFTGVSIDPAGLMANPYSFRVNLGTAEQPLTQLGISINTDEPVVGTTVLATVGEGAPLGGMVIGEVPAETFMSDALGNVTAAKRLVFLTGSRETGGVPVEGSGVWDLTVDGARMFLNAVHYMTGQPVTEPPPIISNLRPISGTSLHLAELGLSFEVGSGTAAGIPVENITLALNGTNVPASQLNITGTAQSRVVTFSNLVADVEYTGSITVTDAGGREAVQTFEFDTLAPVAIPEDFAFPTSAAVTTASGLRARIVQAVSSPTLANNLARAEAQLAGTLIDPATLEPYFNEALPSTDNPDGSYNIEFLNWSVESGLALEKGNFRDPEFPDQPVPGLAHNNNYAVEVLTYLELAPGRYYMGVNSDDGFAVYTGPNARDLFAMQLGQFNNGRGSADSIFQFRITEAGLYPFRLVYFQGDGGGNVEWFTMNPLTGEKFLINDRANPNALRAWRQINIGERPYISSVSPAPNVKNARVSQPLVITIQEPGATISQGSLQLTVNGQAATPQITKNGTTTTVTAPPPLPNDQLNTVTILFTDSASSERTATYSFDTEFMPTPLADGANIAWVSFHEADDLPSAGAIGNGFTVAPDIEYTRLLTNAGHTVTRIVTSGFPDTATLDTYDLVIISRSNPSGNFQTAESTALWHSLTKPTLHLGGYALRGSRLGFFTADAIPDTTNSSVFLNVKSPNHPVFTGIDLNASSNMVNPYAFRVTYNGGLQSGISVNNSPIAPGGTILASIGNPGDPAVNGTVIAEFPPGTTMSNASQDVTVGRRMILLTGSRESGLSGEAAGLFDLEGDGARMFLNAVAYLAGIEIETPTEVEVTAVRSGNNLTISWPESGTEGYALQATASLATPNWQAVAGTPTVSNGQRSLSVPTTDTARFFRLVQQ